MMCSLWRGSLLTLTSSLNRRVFQCCRQFGRSYNIASCMPEAVAFQGVSDHSGLYKFSVNESDRFWGAVARQRLSWISPFHTVQNCDFSQGKIKWFEGGKLNVSGKITFSPQNIQYVRNMFNCFCTAISKPYSS